MKCPNCGSKDIDFHEAGGHSYCVSCGTVVEENTIVSSIEFQESGDRSSVVGQFVSATSSQPYNAAHRARGRFGSSSDSRDATLINIRRTISQVSSSLRLPPLFIDRAYRLYQLALQKNFTFGRRQMHVVATCLYTICRQEKSPHLLIDFSDALQVNVYVLGKCFLQFIRLLNLKMPIIDPSLYIHRFAQRMELGDKINFVTSTALRIITRFKKDWIITGRRPDGICAAAMLISARAHGFHKSQSEMTTLFRIASDTLKARLEDFKATPSAQLTVAQFHTLDSNVEFDPPSYINNQVKTAVSREDGGVKLSESLNTNAGTGGTVVAEGTDENVHVEIVEYVRDDDDARASENENEGEAEEPLRMLKTKIGDVDVEVPLPAEKKR